METRFSGFRDWKEWRRMRALSLKHEGWSQRTIAEALGVSNPAVSHWLTVAERDGADALRSHPAPGRVPQLTAEQKSLIPEFLWHGPEAYGFRGQVWTCARIALVIEQEFGVRYHKDHVGRLLKELGWTPQMPIRRAIQRDEPAIQRWRTEIWPELQKRARRERRVLVFEDETGFYLLAREQPVSVHFSPREQRVSVHFSPGCSRCRAQPVSVHFPWDRAAFGADRDDPGILG